MFERRHCCLDGVAEYGHYLIDLPFGLRERRRQNAHVSDWPDDETLGLCMTRDALPDLDVVGEGFLRVPVSDRLDTEHEVAAAHVPDDGDVIE